MTIDPTMLGLIATAVVVLFGGIVTAAIRWNGAQSRNAIDTLVAHTTAFKQMRAGDPDASGPWPPRSDVADEVRLMRKDVGKIDKRLAVVETNVEWLRDEREANSER